MRKLPFRNFLIFSGERRIDFVARCAARLSPHSPWSSLQNCTTQRVDKSTTPVFYIPFVCKLICAIGDIKNKRCRISSASLCFVCFAERGGFEPPKPFWGLLAFQAGQFNHSCISPFAGAKIVYFAQFRNYFILFISAHHSLREHSPVL